MGSPPFCLSPALDEIRILQSLNFRVFEIATQFNAIFRAQTTSNSKHVSVSLLSMWTSRRVHSFLSLLSVQLNRMEDSASLRDAFDACVFFAVSMGRLGADFTSQLPPIFENKMHDIVTQSWKEGTNQLEETLRVCRDAGVASPLHSKIASNETTPPQLADTASEALEAGPRPPPRQLLAHPPLARLVNAFLTGLNELRRCLLPGIFHRLRKSMEFVLDEVTKILQGNERAVMKPGLRGDAEQLRNVASEFKVAMESVVGPYLRGALEFALGNVDGARSYYQKLDDLRSEEMALEDSKDKETEPPDLEPEESIESATGPPGGTSLQPGGMAGIDEPSMAVAVPSEEN